MPCRGNGLRFRRRRSAGEGKAAGDDEYAKGQFVVALLELRPSGGGRGSDACPARGW